MKQDKYVALDVDSANIVAGVFDSQGGTLMQTHLRTEAKVIQEFFKTRSSSLQSARKQVTKGRQQVGPD